MQVRTLGRAIADWAVIAIVLAAAALLWMAAAQRAAGASVTPILVEGAGNQTCQQLADQYAPGSTWIELKADPNPIGAGPFEYTDGTLTVYITDASEAGFDWTSNIGVDAVFVKSGSSGHNLYRYDTFGPPNTESLGDTDLIPPGQNDISHIAFCYDLELQVSKTATPSFDRDWTWNIVKSADQTNLLLSEGQLFTVNYEVTVSAVSADSNHAVSGSITIHNPTTAAATVSSVTDVVTPVPVNGVVTCPSTLPFPVPAGQSVVCTYTATGLTGTETLNTATVTTSSGPEGGSGTAAINWASATITTETDECVDVTDDNLGVPGTLGTVCAGTADKTFNYPLTFGTPDTADVQLECGENTHTNTATSVTNDTDTPDTSSWTVTATVECNVGCTLTQGYWKTHSQFGPAPFDDAWFTIGDVDGDGTSEGAAERFFSSGKTWYQILWTPPSGGNAYLQLAHQYIAAKLNIVNGADTTAAVNAAIAGAEAFFPGKTPSTSLNNATKNLAKGWATTLDQFNNGAIGPGHCSE